MAKEGHPHPKPLGEEVTVASFARCLASAPQDSVVVICGAGISVSAGIPDFRSKGSGLYDNLQKYNLPTPQSVFTLDFFKQDPMPFFTLARQIYPGNYAPTHTHAFLRLLQDRGVLQRCYTQNIDTLGRIAGVQEDKLVEAHGSFNKAHCLNCGAEHSSEWVKEEIFAERIPVVCPRCGEGFVKPDIVFFGEDLPERFHDLSSVDFAKAQLLIVMGTSLSVEPFASLIHVVRDSCPRLLVNMNQVGLRSRPGAALGLRLDDYDNFRDVALLTTCDQGVQALADAAGWGPEFEELVKSQQHEHRAALMKAQLQAMMNPGHVLGHSANSEFDAKAAMDRSWKRLFREELPPLVALQQRAAEERSGGQRMASIHPVGADSMVFKVAGGSQLNVSVTLHDRVLFVVQGETWLGFVASGTRRPDKVLERAFVAIEACERPVEVSLTVPSLKKSQLEAGMTRTYELWFVKARSSTDGEDVAIARAGPISVSCNVDGVKKARPGREAELGSLVAALQSDHPAELEATASAGSIAWARGSAPAVSGADTPDVQ